MPEVLLPPHRIEILHTVAVRILRATAAAEVTEAAMDGVQRLVAPQEQAIVLIDAGHETWTVVAHSHRAADSFGRAIEELPFDLRRLRQGLPDANPTHVAFPIRDHALLLGLILLAPAELGGDSADVIHEVADLLAAGLRRQRMQEELVQAHDRARRANELKTGFLNHVSHELRTPLNAIIGYLELIAEQDGTMSAADIEQDLQRVHRAAQHLLELINDVLDLGKLEAGKVDITLATVDLSDLLDDVDEVVAPLVATGDNQWRIRCKPGIRVLGDPLRLRQVLLNLLGNAAKFTQRGEIAVEVNANGRTVAIDVVDTGVGIPPELHESLFEPFFQVKGASSSHGTGLGLAITQQYVALMGGTIGVTSRVGQGSRFRVELLQVKAEGPR